MTISGTSSYYYTSSLYGSSNSSTAATAFAQLSSSQSTQAASMPPPPPGGGQDMEAAKAKLQQIDPDLAKKMEDFHDQIDQMKESGASQDEIQQTMKSNMDSLSDTEKSELESVFGKPGQGPQGMKGPGGGFQQDLISQLKQTDSALAEKLQGFQDQIQQLKDSGASEDDIQSAMKSNMDSLSDDEKSELQSAMQTVRSQHHQHRTESSSDTQSSSALSALQSKFASSYLQSFDTQATSAFAFAA